MAKWAITWRIVHRGRKVSWVTLAPWEVPLTVWMSLSKKLSEYPSEVISVLRNAKSNLLYLVMSFKGLKVSGLLDSSATKTFISMELICKVPDRQVVQYIAADKLQIRIPNGEEVQIKGKVTSKVNIEKLWVTFKAHILDITLPLIFGVDFLEHFGVMLDYANGKAAVCMTGCRYLLSLW